MHFNRKPSFKAAQILLIGLLLIISATTLRAGGDPTEKEPQLFELLDPEVTGLKFTNTLKEDIYSSLNVLAFEYYYTGSGVAIGDINNDGLPDAFLTSNTGSNHLFLNKGDFKFEDITTSAGLFSEAFWSSGATMADVNGDGYLDIYVAVGGATPDPNQRANRLYINNGDNTFSEQGATYGINDSNWSIHASFLDYDEDGDLDLFVTNHTIYWRVPINQVVEIMKDPRKLKMSSSTLYRNNGNGSFTDVTEAAGLLNYGYALGLVTTDINGDGLTDIYVANDYTVPDFMYINKGDGTFEDQLKHRVRQHTWYGMGCDIADLTNDGHPEIAVVDMATADHYRAKTLMASMSETTFRYITNNLGFAYQYMFNSIQLNNGNGTFSNVANLLGVAKSDWSWSALLADFDNDGLKDYFISNGVRRYPRDNDFRVAMQKARDENNGNVPNELRQDLYEMMPAIPLANHYYRNLGDLQFKAVSTDWGADQLTYSHGAAWADFDNDGDLDMLVNNTDQPAMLYRNKASELGRNFVQFTFSDPSGKPVLNSKVTLHTAAGIQTNELSPSRGYMSSMDHLVHFGLGTATAVDKAVVQWPDGSFEAFDQLAINQRTELVKGTGKPAPEPRVGLPDLFTNYLPTAKVGYKHDENAFADFDKEILLPHSQSRLGPGLAVGDITGDGLDDFFVPGAKGQPSTLFAQDYDGSFAAHNQSVFDQHSAAEDMGAVVFDANNDGKLDLYVVAGGGDDIGPNSELLNDRLYVNDGKGNLNFAADALPKDLASGGRVKAADFDGDGDQDLFVAGRTQPGRYPEPPMSMLLRNNKGKFEDATAQLAPDLRAPGMVTDFVWTDLDGNDYPDLVVCGEWMPVMYFTNDGKQFTDATDTYGDRAQTGWWYSLAEVDVDADGDLDLVVGNIGTNTKFNPKDGKPLNIYANDFDESGTLDIVIGKYYKGKEVPLRGRQCSSEQMPMIQQSFPTYDAFAKASLQDILGEEKLQHGLHLTAATFQSQVLLRNKNRYEASPLPQLAQIAPINAILPADLNKDGNPDLIVAGNMYNTEVETPRYDAGNGLVLYGNGDGSFTPATVTETGFFAPGDCKDLAWIQLADGGYAVLISNNNNVLQMYKVKGTGSLDR